MELTIKKSKEIKVIPECLAGEDNPPAFIFRKPNAADILSFSINGNNINELMYSCFVRFENKIIIKDENGMEKQYTSYKQLIEMGGSDILTEIHAECALAIHQAISKVEEKGAKTVKKSK
jgi:hypothetical protein